MSEKFFADFVRCNERVHGVVNPLQAAHVAGRQLFDGREHHALVRAVERGRVYRLTQFLDEFLLVAYR